MVRTEKVPARMMPAEVITPPVRVIAYFVPSASPAPPRLFSNARHYVDVVVGAERNEENEDERYGVVKVSVVSKDVFENDNRSTECSRKRQGHAEDEISRGDHTAKQYCKDYPDCHNHNWRYDDKVAVDDGSGVFIGGGFASNEGCGTVKRRFVHGFADGFPDLWNCVHRVGIVRIDVQHYFEGRRGSVI